MTDRCCPQTGQEARDFTLIMTRGLLYFLLLNIYLGTGPVAALDDTELLNRLRSGGHTLYFRHAATDWSNHDQVSKAGDWLSCDNREMRQLSDSGRTVARNIGQAMRNLGIPVAQVLASPYCRTMETARLFGVGPVTSSTDVMNLRAADYFGGRRVIIERARRLLSTPPDSDGNRIVVAHGNVAREATPVYPAEGEGVVFLTDGKGGFLVIERIPPERWHRMLELETRYQGDRSNR